MRKFLFVIFALFTNTVLVYAAGSSSSAATPMSSTGCEVESSPGMLFEPLPRPAYHMLQNYAFDVSGLVSYVSADTAKLLSQFLVGIEKEKQFEQFPVEPVGKTIRIQKVIPTIENLKAHIMYSSFDSNYVYVPFDLDIQVEDSLVIKNYSAFFFMECGFTGYWINHPTGYFAGEYHVFRNGKELSSIPDRLKPKKHEPKSRDRNAVGQLDRGNAKKIRY